MNANVSLQTLAATVTFICSFWQSTHGSGGYISNGRWDSASFSFAFYRMLSVFFCGDYKERPVLPNASQLLSQKTAALSAQLMLWGPLVHARLLLIQIFLIWGYAGWEKTLRYKQCGSAPANTGRRQPSDQKYWSLIFTGLDVFIV